MRLEKQSDRLVRARKDFRLLVAAASPDLRCAPGLMLTLEAENGALDVDRELVGVAVRSAAAIIEALQPAGLVAIEDLVPSDAENPKLPAHRRHLLALEKSRYKPEAFIHRLTLFPRHPGTPKCLKV